MMTLRKVLLAAAIAALWVTAAPVLTESDARAIPAFARKNKVSCTMCHVAAFELQP